MAMAIECRRSTLKQPNVLTIPLYLCLVLILTVLCPTTDCLAKPSSIQLVDNGYEGIVVAIRDDVEENGELIEEITVRIENSILTFCSYTVHYNKHTTSKT